MSVMKRRIVIYGNGQYARMLHQIQEEEEEGGLEIAAFTADRKYIKEDSFLGLPLVAFEAVERIYPPEEHDMLVCIRTSVIRVRKRTFDKAVAKGYRLPNYVSPKAHTHSDLKIGRNNLVFGGAHLGPFGQIGDNNIIRPTAYLGHDYKLGSHNYIAPACSISGYCSIKDLCFIGIGSTLMPHVTLADETLIGAGSLALKSTEPYSKYYGSPAEKKGEHRDTGIVLST